MNNYRKLVPKDLPVIFLSNKEPKADLFYNILLKQVPHALRLEGVKSNVIFLEAALLVKTDYFVTVAADNLVLDSFWETDFGAERSAQPKSALSFQSMNSVNSLRYVTGGVRIWYSPLPNFGETVLKSWIPRFFFVSSIQSVTLINGSAYQAWHSGYRESLKLALQDTGLPITSTNDFRSKQNLVRLFQWICMGRDAPYGGWAILGALEAFLAALLEEEDLEQRIEDYAKIARHWEDFYAHWSTENDPLDVEILEDRDSAIRDRIFRITGLDLPIFEVEHARLIRAMLTISVRPALEKLLKFDMTVRGESSLCTTSGGKV
jgi:hypothetical protein